VPNLRRLDRNEVHSADTRESAGYGAGLDQVLRRLYTTCGCCRCTEVSGFFGDYAGT
jgi:hypothetical protein